MSDLAYYTYSTVLGLHAEIAALKAERDDLKRQLAAYDPCYGDAVVLITDLKAERDRLRPALDRIAWHDKCGRDSLTKLEQAVEIARRALEGK